MRRPLTILALLCTWPALAGENYLDREGALGVAKGPAAAAIQTELTRRNLPCYDPANEKSACRLADRALNAEVHYGTIVATGESVAFVAVRWQYDPTGNAVDARALVFTAPPGGEFKLAAATAMTGIDIRDVRFERGRVTYLAAVLRSGDARANPTGKARFSVSFRGSSSAGRQGAKFGPRSSPPQGSAESLEAIAKARAAFAMDETTFRTEMTRLDGDLVARSLGNVARHAVSLSQGCGLPAGDLRLAGLPGGELRSPLDLRSGPSSEDLAIVQVSEAAPDGAGPGRKIAVLLAKSLKNWVIVDFRGPDPKTPPLTAAIATRARGCIAEDQVTRSASEKDAVATVHRLYAETGYDAFMSGGPNTLSSAALGALFRQVAAVSSECSAYDGDPRIGGAQDTGGLIVRGAQIDAAMSMPGRVVVHVRVGQRNAPKAISANAVTLLREGSQWLVDDISTNGRSLHDALAEAIGRCEPMIKPALRR